MLSEEIRVLRTQLGDALVHGIPYEEIYDLSLKLDELINKYYAKEHSHCYSKEETRNPDQRTIPPQSSTADELV